MALPAQTTSHHPQSPDALQSKVSNRIALIPTPRTVCHVYPVWSDHPVNRTSAWMMDPAHRWRQINEPLNNVTSASSTYCTCSRNAAYPHRCSMRGQDNATLRQLMRDTASHACVTSSEFQFFPRQPVKSSLHRFTSHVFRDDGDRFFHESLCY